jgi:hypothetical protein
VIRDQLNAIIQVIAGGRRRAERGLLLAREGEGGALARPSPRRRLVFQSTIRFGMAGWVGTQPPAAS